MKIFENFEASSVQQLKEACSAEGALQRNFELERGAGSQFLLAGTDIDPAKTKVKSLRAGGICKRFQKAIQQKLDQRDFQEKWPHAGLEKIHGA